MTTAAAAVTYAPPPTTPPVYAPEPEGGKLLYAALQHSEYRLRAAISLSLKVEDGEAVALWGEAMIQGRGPTLYDALTQFRQRVIDAARHGGNGAVAKIVVRQ